MEQHAQKAHNKSQTAQVTGTWEEGFSHMSPLKAARDQLRLAPSMAYRAAWMRDRDGVELELVNIFKQQNVDTA